MGLGETTKTRDRAPGLDGVRALAVLIVIGFHEGASGLPGGFLGVDIFFVLSGFLITDLARLRVRPHRPDGPNGLLDPAGQAPAASAGHNAGRGHRCGDHDRVRAGDVAGLALLAASTYTSNWYQILHHVSYFAAAGQAGAPPPLDHLWSLAIEEQFYLVWPLIV